MKRLSGGEVGRSLHSMKLRRKSLVSHACFQTSQISSSKEHPNPFPFTQIQSCLRLFRIMPLLIERLRQHNGIPFTLPSMLPSKVIPNKDFFFIEIDITKCFLIQACSCYFHQSMIHPRHHHILLRKIEVIRRSLIVHFQWIFYVQIPNTYLRSLFLTFFFFIQTV